MATKVFNMEGGLHSAAAYSAFENRAWGNCVASTDSFVVTAGTGMNARISAGDGLISVNANLARRIQSDAQETVSVAAASTAYNRIDSVVAYIDTSVTPTTSVVDNTNGILKFASVAGTAASSPQAPNQAAIQSAIGAGKPYMVLYNITVPTNATSLTGATFNDQRKVIGIITPEQLPTDIITAPKIKDGAVTNAKIAGGITNDKLANNRQTGWNYTTNPGGQNRASKTVTFPIPYTAPPKVMVTALGYKTGGTPTSVTEFNGLFSGTIATPYVTDITTTGFTMYIAAASGTFGASFNGFTWSAEL